MIRVLIVDDSRRKVTRIKSVIGQILLTDKVEIDVAMTLYDAGVALERTSYDLMILDISIPLRPDEKPLPDGGVRLLENLKARASYQRPTHIIGLTAYDELITKYARELEDEMWFLIKYSQASDEWVCKLGARLVHIAEVNEPKGDDGYDYDLAIITALEDIELEANGTVGMLTSWRISTWAFSDGHGGWREALA